MYLYVYENFRGGQDRQAETEELIRRCARAYAQEEGLDSCADFGPVLREKRGKPRFAGGFPEFSVSHTGSLWVCLMDTQPVGTDVQKIRTCSMDRIARRFYTPDERQYVRDAGEDGFFRIWTRKEAYAKFTGQGLGEKTSAFSTLEGRGVVFEDVFPAEGVRGACCMKEKRDLWIRQIR